VKRYFVTGIGTGVGKTIVSALLTEALQADYWKPIQSGTAEGTDKNTVAALISNTKTILFNEACMFREPASPHVAAALENKTISLSDIRLPTSKNEYLIIEGAGGLLVPLNSKNYVIELAKLLDAEIILVCRNYLGCINHSLLSIDYLLRNNYKIKGLVLNGNFDPLVRSAIINYAGLPVIAEIQDTAEISKEQVSVLIEKVNTKLFHSK
jgi:dethiobiotin synthetase